MSDRRTISPSLRRRVTVLVPAALLVVAGLAPASGANGVSATISGGTSVTQGSPSVTRMYARSGTTLNAEVTTPGSTKCVDVGGTTQVNGAGSSSWSFSPTARATEGLVSLEIRTSNGNNTNCKSSTIIDTSVEYVVDNTGPTLTPTVAPAPNAAGWNKAAVTVSWTATDPDSSAGVPGSGVVGQPASTTISADGTHNVSATFTDRLGNSTTASVTVKLDSQAPSILGTRSPLPNALGWNNTPVTVSLSCADSGSGIKSCSGSQTVNTDGASSSVTGQVVDNADNAAQLTVTGINIDRVPPTLSGTPTTAPNGAGWYGDDVTIHWTANDALSGVNPATAPADAVLTGEGNAVTTAASVADRAGNLTSALSAPLKIDRTAPSTSATSPSDWTNTDATVALSAADGLSGVAVTHYRVDGGPAQDGTSPVLAGEGVHELEYWSVDRAGNEETHHTVEVKVDKTAPGITHEVDPVANPAGWHHSPVTVTFVCTDGLSGVADCTAPQHVTTEGLGQSVAGTATDAAGNSATDVSTVNVDLTDPGIAAAVDRAANGNDWYSDDVIVSFTCSDALSGVNTCAAAQTLGEGADQSVSGQSSDVAGNTRTAGLGGINVDKTGPALTGQATTSPNGNGWYDSSVTVAWACGDALSGIAGTCPADSVVSGEGDDLGTLASVIDRAGNSRTTSVEGIRIDTTAPSTSVGVPDALATAWYAGAVTVTLDGTDGLSGVARTFYQVDGGPTEVYGGPFSHALGGTHTITFWSKDNAGNVEDKDAPGHTITLKVDDIAPLIHGVKTPDANGFGWNNSDVSVSFDCTDGQSAIEHCTDDRVVDTEGQNQSVTGHAEDSAGNPASDTVSGISIDKTAPGLEGEATQPANAFGWYNDDVTVHWTATDALSGVDASTTPEDTVVAGEGNDLVAGPVSAADRAGNTTTASVTPVRIDRTPPSLSGAPTTSPNALGWYNGDVTVHWTASDELSGLDPATVPGEEVLSSEGAANSADAAVSDQAGNRSVAHVLGVKIDRTAPHTAVGAPSEWVNGSTTVTLAATDNLSGVDATYYRINGSDAATGTSIDLVDEGEYELEVWSTDLAGNQEPHVTFTVRVDRTNPTIGHTFSPEPNDAGWNNTDVTVTFHCADALSGIAECTEPQTVTLQGAAQPVPGLARDNAGNRATDPATVSLDESDPTIAGGADRAPNAAGWYRDDVTVSFACTDDLSGVKSCDPAHTTLGEGADQAVTGTAVDAADNEAGLTVGDIDIDKTPPTIEGAPGAQPNAAGWYRGDVLVHWTCADVLSGVAVNACPDASTVAGEGDALSATGTVEDRAGNSTSARVDGIRVDRTAPVTTLDVADPTASGWYAGAVDLTLVTGPDLSGVAGTFYRADDGPVLEYTGTFTFGARGTHTITWWSLDVAGNVEDSSVPGNSQVLRIDDLDPTITASRMPTSGNERGWNNEPVVVHFDCADADSGVATCSPDVTVDSDGADQSVTGTVVDNTGHSSSSTLAGIGVDLTGPSLSGAPLEEPNGAGWYDHDVQVRWTCSDLTSGILGGDCPADSTIVGEGADLGAATNVADNADNTTAASVSGIRIDRTVPTTSLSAPNTWVNDSVTVSLEALDGLSGVRATHYRIDGGAVHDGVQFQLADEGVHEISYWSVDNAGNSEPQQTATVRIDRTRPSVTHLQAPVKNANGWNQTDVTVTFACDDALSGIRTCSGPADLTHEGADQTVTGEAEDNAGNTAPDTAEVSIDKTAPTIGADIDRAANGNGWYAANVLVTFACTDALSGTDCPAPIELAEGENQTAGATATDLAGNTAEAHVSGIDVDKTAPTVSGEATAAPNAAGWYSGDVLVHWACADALSGLDGVCPADSTLTGSGADLSVSAVVQDRAGNQGTVTVSGINVDRVAPATTASVPPPYASGWYDGPIPVTLNASDDLSGVRTTYYRVDGGAATAYAGTFPYAVPGVHTLSFWSVDNAGNTENKASDAHAVTVRIDNRKPTITGAPTTSANGAGWYNAPAQINFSCADAETEVASCGPNATLSASAANQSVTGTARDSAGNVDTYTVSGINIDRVAPTVTLNGVTDGAVYTLGAVPARTCSASDALSGLVSPCAGVTTGGTSNGVGSFSYTATATDRAGNSRTVTASYQVTYRWDGFLTPINDTAHQTGSTTSSFNAGSTVPVRLDLVNASGASVTPSYAPQWITPVRGSAVTSATGAISYPDPVTVGGSYSYQGNKWQYNWSSPKSGAGYYWRIGVKLDDGTTRYVNIALR